MTGVPLREVLDLRNEIVHPRDHPVGDGVFVGLEHIEPGTGRRIGSVQIRLQDLSGRKARFYPGDIVYGYLRPYLNKVWRADIDGYCSVDQYVFKVRPGVNGDYVTAFLRSPQFLGRAPIDTTPGQLPRIRTEEVLSVEIPMPPLDDQLRVAARLTARLAATDHLRQRAVKGRHDIAALRIGLLRAELGLPASGESSVGEPAWPVTLLGDVAHIQLGKMLSPKSKIGTRPVPYLRNANVQWDRLDLSEVYTMDFTETEEAKFTLVRGDLLVCEGGEPGRAAIWNGELNRCCYQKALHRIRPKGDKLDPEFLLHRLRLGGLTNEFVGTHAKTTIAHLPAIRPQTSLLHCPQWKISGELQHG